MPALFTSFTIKNMTLKNRVVMAPMCQYMVDAQDGMPTWWHMQHYVSRAVGGVGLIMLEATAVLPEGRISNQDLGIWNDEQAQALSQIVKQVHAAGGKIGIQLAHAGRKAADEKIPMAPSALAYPGYNVPNEMTETEIQQAVEAFGMAARRAVKAGFDTIEVHGAHGYLIHQFMSPLINVRRDDYGLRRSLFGTQVVQAVKAQMPTDMPLLMRVSAVEYQDKGYGIDYAIEHCKAFANAGVDVFDVSSGGEAEPGQKKPGNFPGYQVPFARAFRQELNLPTIAVGFLEDAYIAESVVANKDADLVALGRGLLRNPYWAYDAEQRLIGQVATPPPAYKRGFNIYIK